MFLKMLFSSLILISLAMLGMMLKVLVKKKGKFPAYMIGHNRDMHKLGINCVKHEEIRCHNKELKKDQGCGGCQTLA